MLYKNNKAYGDNVNIGGVPFLATYAAQNGQRLNERKAKSLRLSKLYYKRAEALEGAESEAMKKRAGRVFGCCSKKEVAISDSGYCYTLHCNRCRDRSCQECQRLRAFVLQQKIRQILPDLIAQTDAKDGLIFGTLTVKNPLITELKDYLKILSKAFARMFKRKEFKKIFEGRGGFRCFEVTRGESGADYCHPHIHFLLQVKAAYFARNSPLYINSEQWAEAWTDCLKLEIEKTGRVFNYLDYPSGKAFVKILRVQATDYTRENRKYATVGMLEKQDNIINYVLKYTAKSDDENSKKALVKDDPWFFEYDKNIKNCRAVAFFGIYKTLISNLTPPSYDEKAIKADLNNNKAKFYTAVWDDDHQYLALESTEEKALEAKRHNTVSSIKATLKSQLKSKNYILDIIDLAFKKKDYITVQKEISAHNTLAGRVLKTFERLEKSGEVIKVKDGFLQHYHNFLFKSVIFECLPDLISESEIENIKKENEKIIEVIENDPPF